MADFFLNKQEVCYAFIFVNVYVGGLQKIGFTIIKQ